MTCCTTRRCIRCLTVADPYEIVLFINNARVPMIVDEDQNRVTVYGKVANEDTVGGHDIVVINLPVDDER